MVLGLPWLKLHNPVVDWRAARVLQWGSQCGAHIKSIRLRTTSIESPEVKCPLQIPPQYSDLVEVFSTTKAARLLPHRHWNCAIDLLSGKEPPRSCVYPLSERETRAMEEYITEALRQGYIR